MKETPKFQRGRHWKTTSKSNVDENRDKFGLKLTE
jgi:hypothetical protein